MRCDAFCVDQSFIRRPLQMSVRLVDAAEGTSGGAKRCPRSLPGMAMHCASAIPVIIPRPGVDTMADRRMGGMTAPVALPCVGVQPRAASRHGFGDERTARLPVRVGAPPEALRTRVACHHADEGGPSMGRRAVACACRGASTWRVAGSGRGRALFPRRAGTARRPPRRCRSSRRSARWRAGGPARAAATCAAVCLIAPTPGLRVRWVRLSPCRAAGVPTWLGVGGSFQRRYGSAVESGRHTPDNGRPGRRPAAGRVGARGDDSEGMPTPRAAGDALPR
jgi:hypothetical protein